MKAKKRVSVSKITALWMCICLMLMQENANAGQGAIVEGSGRWQSHVAAGALMQQLRANEAVAVLTRYEVKEAHREKFRKALGKYVRYVNAKKSNIMAEAYYEEENPSVLWVIERWSSRKRMDKIVKSLPFRTIKWLAKGKLAQPVKTIYVNDLEPLSKMEWRRAPGMDDQPITIMLFVDSKPGTEDVFKDVYHTAMPQFRSEPGVINYQLSQLADDSTQFVTYEKFRNEDAFQYHLNFPPIQPVLDYLNTSIKKQPFQTGLHRLIAFAPINRQ